MTRPHYEASLLHEISFLCVLLSHNNFFNDKHGNKVKFGGAMGKWDPNYTSYTLICN